MINKLLPCYFPHDGGVVIRDLPLASSNMEVTFQGGSHQGIISTVARASDFIPQVIPEVSCFLHQCCQVGQWDSFPVAWCCFDWWCYTESHSMLQIFSLYICLCSSLLIFLLSSRFLFSSTAHLLLPKGKFCTFKASSFKPPALQCSSFLARSHLCLLIFYHRVSLCPSWLLCFQWIFGCRFVLSVGRVSISSPVFIHPECIMR